MAFALTRSYLVALALLLAAATLNLAFSSMAQTLVQLLAPSEPRGRVVGLFNVSQQGLRVGSSVTVGVLGSFIRHPLVARPERRPLAGRRGGHLRLYRGHEGGGGDSQARAGDHALS